MTTTKLTSVSDLLTAVEIVRCPRCKQMRHIDVQPALMPGREPTALLTCKNTECAGYLYTVDARDEVGNG